jgi:hypothetical protein
LANEGPLDNKQNSKREGLQHHLIHPYIMKWKKIRRSPPL